MHIPSHRSPASLITVLLLVPVTAAGQVSTSEALPPEVGARIWDDLAASWRDVRAGSDVLAAFNTGTRDDSGPDINALRVETSRRVVDELFPAMRRGGRR